MALTADHKLTLIILLILGITGPLAAQQGPPQHVREAVQSVETMLRSDTDEGIANFIREAMVPEEIRDQEALVQRLQNMREEVQGMWDEIGVEPAPDGVLLTLSGDGDQRQIRINITEQGVKDLHLVESPEPLNLSADNIEETIRQLEGEGMAGVLYLVLHGEIIAKRGFGMANASLEIPNSVETVFGIGSRPIDFTRAAIHLLEQQGKLEQQDSIAEYFDKVPADKQPITIHHLMTGQSGLPDFFHTAQDWDPDLAWIDRGTAEERILSQDLLFEPGTDRRHSHGAFVLLAALTERVSGLSYYEFLEQHFFVPAGMTRTHEYGDRAGLSIADFAVGSGPQQVGLPNIPPNWGPTSWLIKGSGGMYSTLGDLLKFYEYVRSDKLFTEQHRTAFTQKSITLDGSDRGFELFNAYQSPDRQVYLFLNNKGDVIRMRQLFQSLEEIVMQSTDD